MAVRTGKLFKFTLVGGHLNDKNELVLDPIISLPATDEGTRLIAYVRRESDSFFATSLCYDFVVLDPMNSTDKIIWWPQTCTYKQGMTTLQPIRL
jgi:hypothetical protein